MDNYKQKWSNIIIYKYKKGLKKDESLQNRDLSNKSSDRIDS